MQNLSATSELRRAVNDVAVNVSKLLAIPADSYARMCTSTTRLPKRNRRKKLQSDVYVRGDVSSSDIESDSSVDSDGEVGASGIPPWWDTLSTLADALPLLHDALCNIETYRPFSDDYIALLMFHDEVKVRFLCIAF